MSTSKSCELDLIACLFRFDEHGVDEVPVTVELTFRQDDPYAVYIGFPTSVAGVQWMISRDLLIAGVKGRAGDGDVNLMTISGGGGDAVTILTLGRRWSDEVTLSILTDELVAFLALTEDVVPVGTESALAQDELRTVVQAWTRCDPSPAGEA